MRRAVTLLLLVLIPAEAGAGANDLNLTGLVLRSPTPTFSEAIHSPLFKKLSTELGIAIAPQFTSPSETLGSLGFEVGFSTAVTPVHQGEAYWQWARRTDEGVDRALALTSFHVRKGLPASFELEGNFSWLANSEMYAMGLAVKWALNEGFYFIPDVALRGSVNLLLGARDLQIVTSGFDLSLSKKFAIGGTSTLTPYAGYNLLIINSNSHVLDPTPLEDLDVEKSFVFAPQTLFVHRMFLGLRFRTYFVTLTGAVELAFSSEIPWMQRYLGKLAFAF
jgi:hypothetical protein